MPNHDVAAAGEAMPAGNTLKLLKKMLVAGDTQGALSLLSEQQELDVVTPPISPVFSAFLNWQMLYEHANKKGLSEKERERRCDTMAIAADRLMEIPSTGPFDVLAKWFAITDRAECPIREGWEEAIASEISSSLRSCLQQTSSQRTSADPLVDAIQAYRNGLVQFDAISVDDLPLQDEEAVAMATYGAPLDVLEAWDDPAPTREGAIEALKLVNEKMPPHMIPAECGMIIEPLLRSVRGYLESLQECGSSGPMHRSSKPEISMLGNFDMSRFVGNQWDAVYDALSLAISGISGIESQPRCEDKPHILNPAGDYLDDLSEFLINERERLIKKLQMQQPGNADERRTRASLLVRYQAECGELSMAAMAAYALSLATSASAEEIN